MKAVALALVVLLTSSFGQTALAADPEREMQALLQLHEAGRQAHFRTDVEALLKDSPDEFISVAGGKIHRSTREDQRKLFTRYFSGATYLEWDDMEEPIVRVSADGSMAWMITRVKVRRTQTDAAGDEKEEKFVYAGIMTYEKRDDAWIRVANVSTFEPAD